MRFEPQSHPLARRKLLFRTFGISLVLDVGANVGQYAEQIRNLGYRGRIVSFEPLSSAYLELQEKAATDRLWETYNLALGDKNEERLINISRNRYSSSLLPNLPANIESEPNTEYIGQERVDIRTLDSMIETVCATNEEVYLKIDTQGYEERVLVGATEALERIDTIQLEMSLVRLYDDSMLFEEMLKLLRELGYRLAAVEPGFTNKRTGEILQLDGIFHRYR